jgi:hypothetical protein
VIAAAKKMRNEYLVLRRPYEPESVRLVIIAESPPASGLYFYNPDGRTTEPLFTAMMRELGISCVPTKADGLVSFQRCGWLLVDATHEPVNKCSPSEREKIIERDYPLLHDDLAMLTPDRSTPLVLIKANVCRILEPKLVEDRFNVLNRGIVVPFPSSGRQKQFHRQFDAVLKSAGIRQC